MKSLIQGFIQTYGVITPGFYATYPNMYTAKGGIRGGGLNQDYTIKPVIDKRMQWINISLHINDYDESVISNK